MRHCYLSKEEISNASMQGAITKLEEKELRSLLLLCEKRAQSHQVVDHGVLKRHILIERS